MNTNWNSNEKFVLIFFFFKTVLLQLSVETNKPTKKKGNFEFIFILFNDVVFFEHLKIISFTPYVSKLFHRRHGIGTVFKKKKNLILLCKINRKTNNNFNESESIVRFSRVLISKFLQSVYAIM